MCDGRDGNFSLEVTPNSSIKVSFIGYKSQTIAIKAEQQVYNVILHSDNVLIDELVVVGYGVKKKQTLTLSLIHISIPKQNWQTLSSI